MSEMRLLDRHVGLLSGSLRTLVQRESDRRRFADTPHGWLFQPYMGEEAVALACRESQARPGELRVAAVVLTPRRVLTSHAWSDTLTTKGEHMPHRQERDDAPASSVDSGARIEALAEFIGNRPVVGWQLDALLAPLGRMFKASLGFGLPNAQVDLARLHARQLRRLHPQAEVGPSINEALSCWSLPLAWPSVHSEATAAALLYQRLQSERLFTV